MQFNSKALNEKMNHLDEILEHQDILESVVKDHFDETYSIKRQQRKWTGGGGTPYLITTDSDKVFLKVKSRFVTVESKLEEEDRFIEESCLFHEYKMLKAASEAGVSIPEIVFFEERGNFEFLAIKYIDRSLIDRLETASLEDCIQLFKSLEKNVKRLFDAGLIHSDLHEYNIRVDSSRPKEVILIDFEECRNFKQSCDFEDSLDYIGKNKKSSLGEFPLCDEQEYTIRINCLQRMHQIFEKYVAEKTIEYIKECNYDSSNGICITIDHGKSEETYQSINNAFFRIAGQRGIEDKRPEIIKKICDFLFDKEDYIFIDIGSNNGLFCREMSKHLDGKIRCIGLEGFSKFNVLARALAFLDNCKNVCYYDFLCGEDDLGIAQIHGQCFMTICSVWHHIQHKEKFLAQLKQINLKYIFLEMAVQEECYDGHSWEQEVDTIIRTLEFATKLMVGYSSDYNRPLILISKDFLSEQQKKKVVKIAKSVFKMRGSRRIRNFLIG